MSVSSEVSHWRIRRPDIIGDVCRGYGVSVECYSCYWLLWSAPGLGNATGQQYVF